jgi:adenosylcobinamide-GDP ribazoletransferase
MKNKDFFDGIKYGISYFTIFPIRLKDFQATKDFYKGVAYSLMISGVLLFCVVVGLYLILPLPKLYLSIVVSVVYLFLYGFLHLEAVADTIDGYFAKLSNKDIYTIMKEPHIGSIGAIGVFCFVILKILALGYLLYYEQYFFIFVSFVLSRAILFFAVDFTFHQKSFFINAILDAISYNKLKYILFFGYIFVKPILKNLQKKLGFLNGDTLGFTIELSEIIYLNIAIAICC